MSRALITSVPFGAHSTLPFELLQDAGIEYVLNPYNRKLTEQELADLVTDFDTLIAGTEAITATVMDRASRLTHISRIGVGLDGVDLMAARRRGIRVSYTPEAPAPAVAELTIGLMLALLRLVHVANTKMHRGEWQRIYGRRLAEVTVGIIGVGRIGRGVLKHLVAFGPRRILANDVTQQGLETSSPPVEWVSKDTVYEEADVITVHVPLTSLTRNMIGRSELLRMRPDAVLINVARGGIVNEHDLYEVMTTGHLAGAAVDVFEHEPYSGPLASIERCLLTSHMGSMSVDCRTRMEIEATEEAVRFLLGKGLSREVPVDEYELQRKK